MHYYTQSSPKGAVGKYYWEPPSASSATIGDWSAALSGGKVKKAAQKRGKPEKV